MFTLFQMCVVDYLLLKQIPNILQVLYIYYMCKRLHAHLLLVNPFLTKLLLWLSSSSSCSYLVMKSECLSSSLATIEKPGSFLPHYLQLLKRVFAMTNVFSWQNSVSLLPASFCTPRPNLPVTPGISWLPTFTFQSLIMKRTSFLGVSSRGSCRSS